MKITHIPKDKLIEIRYESDTEKTFLLKEMSAIAKMSFCDVEELKQTE